MGLFAPAGTALSAWLGTRLAMTIGLVLIGVFGILRGVVPSPWLVIALTLPLGIGMGIGNATAPLAVRETVPERPATGTGIYATGIQLGSAIAAAVAVPLAAVLGGWRGALIALAGPFVGGLGAAAVWAAGSAQNTTWLVVLGEVTVVSLWRHDSITAIVTTALAAATVAVALGLLAESHEHGFLRTPDRRL